jgi:hypothetical protein
MISPAIRAVPAIQPTQCSGRLGCGGGTISAIGLPNRVTSTGLRVFANPRKHRKAVSLELGYSDALHDKLDTTVNDMVNCK